MNIIRTMNELVTIEAKVPNRVFLEHEALDRLNTVSELMESLLSEHPGILAHADITALVNTAQQSILEAYQLMGDRHL